MQLTIRIALLALVLSSIQLSAQEHVEVRGSDAMIMLGQRWAQRLSVIFPAARLDVGGGNADAITMLSNKSAGVIQLPRQLSARERGAVETGTGRPVLQFPVAIESIVIYVNDQNRVQEITVAQLRDIYLGKIDNWSAVGGRNERIQLYSTENFVGGSLYFRETVLSGGEFDFTMRGYSNSKQMIEAVGSDANGIGFGGPLAQPHTKRLRIKREGGVSVDPSNSENLRSGRYPLSHYLYWAVREPISSNLRQICNWIVSSQGQLIVESLGYFPLNAEDRNRAMGAITAAK